MNLLVLGEPVGEWCGVVPYGGGSKQCSESSRSRMEATSREYLSSISQ